jgi:plastocyanin
MPAFLARRTLAAVLAATALALGLSRTAEHWALPAIAQSTPAPDAESGQAPAPESTAVSESESRIRMRNDTFYYDYVFVPAGTTITWVNEEPDPANAHNILAEDGSFTSPLVMPGESWQYTFTTPGYYRYFCELHDGMEGAVLVEGE